MCADAVDIVDGNEKIIMALVWQLILHFAIIKHTLQWEGGDRLQGSLHESPSHGVPLPSQAFVASPPRVHSHMLLSRLRFSSEHVMLVFTQSSHAASPPTLPLHPL